jgi:dihydroorotate dehydrogenase electron transfer subunit
MEIKICRIKKNEVVGNLHYLMEFENNFKESFSPGNFVYIKIENNFLRRPFSVSGFSKNSLKIIYKIVGEGTEKLSKKEKGECVDVLGPCGNSFPLFENKKIAIIGGGTGIAPLIFLCERLKKYKNEIDFFFGAKNKELLFLSILPPNINYIFTTEDGSFGKRGNIFDVFYKFKDIYEVIYASGPEELLKKISKLSDKIPIYLSLENYMGCGMGLCYGCVVKVKVNNGWIYKRVCKEGPVFSGKEIIWE